MSCSKKTKIITSIIVISVISIAILLGFISLPKFQIDSTKNKIMGININDINSANMALPMGGFIQNINLNNTDQKNIVAQVINWLKSDSNSLSNKTRNKGGEMNADPWTHIILHFKDNSFLDMSFYDQIDGDGEINITGTFIGNNRMVEKSQRIAKFLNEDYKKIIE